jgi:integrase
MKVRGGIRQRGGRWQVRYWGVRPDGERGECSEAAATEEEARGLLNKRLRELANHFEGIKKFEGPRRERVTVGELLDSLAAAYRQAEIKSLRHTIGVDGKGGHMRPLRDAFERTKAMAVTADRIRAYVANRQAQGKSNATINRETEILSKAFRLAVADGRLAFMLAVPAALPERNTRQGFFEREDFEAIVRELPDDLKDVARFGYLTGWRRGEIGGLSWENVDRAAAEIRIFDSKNGEGRVIPMDDEIAALIERRWAAREYRLPGGGVGLSQLVFHLAGRPRINFNKRWRKACRRAGLPGKLFHDFRRTAVRDLVRSGVPETVAMTITGHKTRSVFQRYNITSREDKIDALRRRRAYLAERESTSNVVELRKADLAK